MSDATIRSQVSEITNKNFGFLIAYVIPGFIVVAIASVFSPTVKSWLGVSTADAPTVGGFLYVTLGSVGAGMTLSAIRWLVLDRVHHWTGVPKPEWDITRLPVNLAAFETFVEYSYRHFLFYGNSLVALVISLAAWPKLFPLVPIHPAVGTAGLVGLIVLFFVASRDNLRKYVARTNVLLQSPITEKEIPDDQRLPF